jgi:hypothetical protein
MIKKDCEYFDVLRSECFLLPIRYEDYRCNGCREYVVHKGLLGQPLFEKYKPKYNRYLTGCFECCSPIYIKTQEEEDRYVKDGMCDECRNKIFKKPPLGLRPKFVVDELRVREIKEAIVRYLDGFEEIPHKWIREYNNRIQSIKKETR